MLYLRSGRSDFAFVHFGDRLEEQIRGWSALARSAKTPQAGEHAAMLLASLIVSWNRFAITPMTVPGRTQFELLVSAKLNLKRKDLQIAAIAKEVGATVMTRNRRDFGRVPGLVIEDWAT
jgi:tRNA(fMet)-specific endonuclease VapC